MGEQQPESSAIVVSPDLIQGLGMGVCGFETTVLCAKRIIPDGDRYVMDRADAVVVMDLLTAEAECPGPSREDPKCEFGSLRAILAADMAHSIFLALVEQPKS